MSCVSGTDPDARSVWKYFVRRDTALLVQLSDEPKKCEEEDFHFGFLLVSIC